MTTADTSMPAAPARRRHRAGERLGTRLVWGLLFVLPAAVLATAVALTPDPAGHGTHTQLGLPPCGFIVFLGVPCPGCGLTTAFSHMVRLDLPGAFGANPFGVLLFLVTVASLPVSVVGALRALPVVDTLERLQLDRVLMVLAIASMVTWLARLAVIFLGS